jgi:hypothetical protein
MHWHKRSRVDQRNLLYTAGKGNVGTVDKAAIVRDHMPPEADAELFA